VELEKIKTCLEEQVSIPDSTAQRFHQLSNEIKRQGKKTEEKIGYLAELVRGNLEQYQIYQLQEFVPCIIPPKGELRIGQTGEKKGLVKQLERIRKIPNRIYERRKADVIHRTLQRLMLHTQPGIEMNKDELTEHIQSVFQKARSLTDVNFEIQKKNLAEELVAPIKPSHPNKTVTRKIEVFLLCHEIIPILEGKLQPENY
jgi:hypothetical protein